MARRLDEVFREEWSRVLANLIRFTGDLGLAEECAQEAFARAAEAGLEDATNPGAWLTTVAKRIAIDRMRREATFVACHPHLAEESQIALALRLVCGVTTPGIAFAVSGPGGDRVGSHHPGQEEDCLKRGPL